MVRGLALHQSLVSHASAFRLWVLCADDTTYDIIRRLDLPSVQPIALRELEEHDPELRLAKSNRSLIEYYFTCTPCLPLYVFAKAPEVELLTYLDADLYFFSNPAPIFDEMGARSIAIVEHRFPAALKRFEAAGRYNVGWLSFRRDDEGLRCLRTW